MSDLLPHRRGLGASLISVTYGIGGAIGAVLASRLVAAFGWRTAFLTVGVIAAADMLLQLYWVRDRHQRRSVTRSGSIRSAISTPIAILAFAEFIGGSVFWSCAAWTPTALRAAKALSLQETGWVMSALSIANMLGSFILGNASDKWSRKRVIVASAIPSAAAAFVVFHWLDSVLALAVGIFVFGLLKASVPALVVALAQEAAPPSSAGTAAGIIMSLHYTAGVLAPLISAQLITSIGDILWAMILVSSVPLIFYAALVSAVPVRVRENIR
jgi:MFS transporter, OFA family, oxalate/formate antiporter